MNLTAAISGSSREISEAIMRMTMIHVEMLDVLCSQEILVKCSVISHCTRIHGVILMNTLLHFTENSNRRYTYIRLLYK